MSDVSKPMAMRRMAEEVAACFASCSLNGNGWQAQLTFPPDFAGFQGHFPGQPVVPGVCLIEAVTQVAARRRNAPLRITTIANAKFYRPVGPDQVIDLHAEFQERDGGEEVRAKLTCAEAPVADIVLRLAAPPT